MTNSMTLIHQLADLSALIDEHKNSEPPAARWRLCRLRDDMQLAASWFAGERHGEIFAAEDVAIRPLERVLELPR